MTSSLDIPELMGFLRELLQFLLSILHFQDTLATGEHCCDAALARRITVDCIELCTEALRELCHSTNDMDGTIDLGEEPLNLNDANTHLSSVLKNTLSYLQAHSANLDSQVLASIIVRLTTFWCILRSDLLSNASSPAFKNNPSSNHVEEGP